MARPGGSFVAVARPALPPILTGTDYRDAVIADGPDTYLRLHNAEAGETAEDLSGNNRPGTFGADVGEGVRIWPCSRESAVRAGGGEVARIPWASWMSNYDDAIGTGYEFVMFELLFRTPSVLSGVIELVRFGPMRLRLSDDRFHVWQVMTKYSPGYLNLGPLSANTSYHIRGYWRGHSGNARTGYLNDVYSSGSAGTGGATAYVNTGAYKSDLVVYAPNDGAVSDLALWVEKDTYSTYTQWALRNIEETAAPQNPFTQVPRPSNPQSDNLWFTDFAEYAADAEPADWQQQSGWGVNQTVQVVDHGTYGRVLYRSTTQWDAIGGFLAWDKPGVITGDMEVVFRALSGTPYIEAPALRCNDAEQGYAFLDSGGGFDPNYDIRAMARSVIHGSPADSNYQDTGIAKGQWVWVRLQLIGTVLRGRAWLVGDPEPGSWQTTLDLVGETWIANITEGKAGIAWANLTGAIYINAFGVSSNPSEEPAPMSAVEVGSVAFAQVPRPGGSFVVSP